ncbi:Alpha/Beta hydrolase protein [Aspergillus cavernicola]|uniref:Alpha/Beta hydrolase protein n=1 Tax=Aspergillus cavernicola TaxID=176166 RepID=A0ABR4IGC2_9EURO
MASESLEASRGEFQDRDQQNSAADNVPHAARGTAATPAPMAWFPLGYREGFSQWWSSAPAAAAEHRVLSHLPYLQHQPPTHLQTGKTADGSSGETGSLQSADQSQQSEVAANSLDDPYGPRRWLSSMVQLSGKNRALNEFSVERVGEEADQHLVMLHGYGAGLGFFYKNFEPLSRLKGWQLHALDLLGMGRSTRPPFRIKAKEREDAISEAEDWFVDALEEWRIKRNIDRFTLLGHSLGGYIAVNYALKYPGRINKLILASPVGIPEDPYAMAAEMPGKQDQAAIAAEAAAVPPGNVSPKGDNNILLKGPSADASSSNDRPPRRTIPKWIAYLWEANISPFSLVRWAGPLGPRLVSGWTSRRFSHLPADEAKALHDYSYSIFSMRGSGEYALAYILAPGAFARSPLIRRIEGLGRQLMPATVPSVSTNTSEENNKRENGLPVVFMYGDHDWMDYKGGVEAVAKITKEKQRILANATPEEHEADNGSAKVVMIKNSGHHVYLDGYKQFNDAVLSEMEEVARKERSGH